VSVTVILDSDLHCSHLSVGVVDGYIRSVTRDDFEFLALASGCILEIRCIRPVQPSASLVGLCAYLRKTCVKSQSPKTGNLASSVLVIVDPNYGERLRQVWPGQPVWIAMSSTNEPTVRSLWASHPDGDHLSGITGFRFDANARPENSLLDNLNMIDLHHGLHSSKDPYTVLEVSGARLTIDVRDALSKLGFEKFLENTDGFTARRSREEAVKARD
jgi:hypothetical protein